MLQQQVLPAYGQGVGEQNMGMYVQNQQGQQMSNRFGRDNRQDRGRMSQRNQKVALVRRNDDRGRIGSQRGLAKKR